MDSASTLSLEDSRPKHECGVCGIFGHEDAAKLTYFGLYALQHRGQESAGIVASDGKKVSIHKAMGLVPASQPALSQRPAPPAVPGLRRCWFGLTSFCLYQFVAVPNSLLARVLLPLALRC